MEIIKLLIALFTAGVILFLIQFRLTDLVTVHYVIYDSGHYRGFGQMTYSQANGVDFQAAREAFKSNDSNDALASLNRELKLRQPSIEILSVVKVGKKWVSK